MIQYHRKHTPVPDSTNPKRKAKTMSVSAEATGTCKKARNSSDPPKKPLKKIDALQQEFDKAVTAAVAKGDHPDDASACLISNLIDGNKNVARYVAATPIGGSTVVDDMVASQIEMGRDEFERGLQYIVDRGTFSNKTYSDSVQPTVNKMMKVNAIIQFIISDVVHTHIHATAGSDRRRWRQPRLQFKKIGRTKKVSSQG